MDIVHSIWKTIISLCVHHLFVNKCLQVLKKTWIMNKLTPAFMWSINKSAWKKEWVLHGKCAESGQRTQKPPFHLGVDITSSTQSVFLTNISHFQSCFKIVHTHRGMNTSFHTVSSNSLIPVIPLLLRSVCLNLCHLPTYTHTWLKLVLMVF